MNLIIQSIHFDASDRLKDFIQKKCDKLEQFYDRILDGNVTLRLHNEEKENNKFVEIRLRVPGPDLIAADKADSFEKATQNVVRKLEVQLKKYKEKQKA